MARIIWSRVGRDDLRAIVAAEHVRQLETFPESGRLVPEDLTETYRELIFGDYRVVYRYAGDIVTIVTVIHGARMFTL